MKLHPTAVAVVKQLATLHTPDVFNPYRDRDPRHDRTDAPAIRRRNLATYLTVMACQCPTELWLAESGSHTGTRRSGLPLIPTTAVEGLNDRFGVGGFAKATRTEDRAGMTAGYVWDVALQYPPLPLFWNAVMAQPHRPGAPYVNRTARRATLRSYQPVLRLLLDWFTPATVVAIGRLPAFSLQELGVAYQYVRHPAQGGARAFRAGIAVLKRPAGGTHDGAGSKAI